MLADDFRIEMRFAVAAGSEFADELTEHFRRWDMRVVDWQDATSKNFDLALSASSNGALHELDMPVVTFPHGAGHHKYRATEEGFADEVSGLSRTQLMHDGHVVPTVIGLPHESQLDLLHRHCAEALGRAEVIGDPCYDRLRVSLPMREHYRRALGTGARKLVLVTSTWGKPSLFGKQGELAWELARELPSESYQVALVLHPNIWARHSRFQVRQWNRQARRAGLLMIPPHEGWRAALVAADVVISDHGSLAVYSAALGKPLLLAAFGSEEIVPGTPVDFLGAHAPGLAPVGQRRSQIDAADPFDSQWGATVFAGHLDSARRLRRVVYERLGLSEPSWPAPTEPVEPFIP